MAARPPSLPCRPHMQLAQTVMADQVQGLVNGSISVQSFAAATSKEVVAKQINEAKLKGVLYVEEDSTEGGAPAANTSKKSALGVGLGVGLGLGLTVAAVVAWMALELWTPPRRRRSILRRFPSPSFLRSAFMRAGGGGGGGSGGGGGDRLSFARAAGRRSSRSAIRQSWISNMAADGEGGMTSIDLQSSRDQPAAVAVFNPTAM